MIYGLDKEEYNLESDFVINLLLQNNMVKHTWLYSRFHNKLNKKDKRFDLEYVEYVGKRYYNFSIHLSNKFCHICIDKTDGQEVDEYKSFTFIITKMRLNVETYTTIFDLVSYIKSGNKYYSYDQYYKQLSTNNDLIVKFSKTGWNKLCKFIMNNTEEI